MNNKFVQASVIRDRSKQELKRLSSREVAPMMGNRHDFLLAKIDRINKDFNEHKIEVVKYWVEGTYIDAKGEKRREFQISKKGCEFLAHKTTGTKGNLFTDKYMDRFEQMENVIQNNLPVGIETMQGMAFLSENMAAIGQHVQFLTKFTMDMKEYFQDSIQVKDHQIDQAIDLIGIRSKNTHRLTRKLKDTLFEKYEEYISATDIRYIAARDKAFKEFKVTKWEELSVKQYNAVEAFIDEALLD